MWYLLLLSLISRAAQNFSSNPKLEIRLKCEGVPSFRSLQGYVTRSPEDKHFTSIQRPQSVVFSANVNKSDFLGRFHGGQ